MTSQACATMANISTQQTYDVVSTSMRRLCDSPTSYRRLIDVETTSCVYWVNSFEIWYNLSMPNCNLRVIPFWKLYMSFHSFDNPCMPMQHIVYEKTYDIQGQDTVRSYEALTRELATLCLLTVQIILQYFSEILPKSHTAFCLVFSFF